MLISLCWHDAINTVNCNILQDSQIFSGCKREDKLYSPRAKHTVGFPIWWQTASDEYGKEQSHRILWIIFVDPCGPGFLVAILPSLPIIVIMPTMLLMVKSCHLVSAILGSYGLISTMQLSSVMPSPISFPAWQKTANIEFLGKAHQCIS